MVNYGGSKMKRQSERWMVLAALVFAAPLDGTRVVIAASTAEEQGDEKQCKFYCRLLL